MPKSELSLASGEYAPVADRILLFYERYPNGRIVTELVSRTEREVVFRASVFRAPDDAAPAATGWAAEREGDGDVNAVACLENTETSAIGRALANLGFTASAKRPSAEEMQKVMRVREQLARTRVAPQSAGRASGTSRRAPRVDDMPLQRRANAAMDVISLVRSAERAGLRPLRARRFADLLGDVRTPAADVERLARLLRRWLRKHASMRQSMRAEPGGSPVR